MALVLYKNVVSLFHLYILVDIVITFLYHFDYNVRNKYRLNKPVIT